MNRSQKQSLRFKVSFLWAIVTALIVFLSGYTLVTLVKVKRINDLATHSARLSNQIANLSPLRLYLLEQSGAPDKSEAETILRVLLAGDPFIEELVLVDQFGKIPFNIVMKEGDPSLKTEQAPVTFPLQDLLLSQQPSFIEENWEYRIPITLESNVPWGIMQVKWRPDATWRYFRLLKVGIAYITGFAFCIAYLFAYLLIRKTYDREQTRLAKSLSAICGSDYSQRIDTQSYSKGASEIGVHLNRILHEIEEEKKKSEILDQSLRQIERGCSDYRRALTERSGELDTMRREMRMALINLFDLLWCGIIVIDDQYRIQYINEQAERLLRFARLEDSVIMDERLKTCLSPLVRHGSVDAIDDLCVWPQPSLGQSVSCHVRASRIPTGGGDRLYYLLLREEGGYPKKHNSAYYSERLVLDYLVHDTRLEETGGKERFFSEKSILQGDRFRACLRRLETFHALEKGDVGPVSLIRLTSWLRNHYRDEDLAPLRLQLDANIPDLDVSLRIPERILRELMDTILVLINGLIEFDKSRISQSVVIRASLDSRGKPMITISLPRMTKKESAHIHEVLNERVEARQNECPQDSSSLEDMEMDICYSLFRCVKQLLRAHIVCVYSEIKKLAMVRLTIENQTFISNSGQSDSAEDQQESAPNMDLIQLFLSRI